MTGFLRALGAVAAAAFGVRRGRDAVKRLGADSSGANPRGGGFVGFAFRRFVGGDCARGSFLRFIFA